MMLVERSDCTMVGWASHALPFTLHPQKPIQLYAMRQRAIFNAMPLLQCSFDVLHSLNGTGSDLYFLLTASWQLLQGVHLQCVAS